MTPTIRRRHRRAILTTLTALTGLAMPRAQDGGVSTVGRAVAKRFADLGQLPAPATIAVADLINYHHHDVRQPSAGQSVALDLRWDRALPAETDEIILQVGIATPFVHDATHLEPLNLALVVDVSGSMNDDRKIDCVKLALCRFIRQLRPADRLAIVAYCDVSRVVWESQRVGDGRSAQRAVEQLRPNGRTNLHAGLMLGYQQVAQHGDTPQQTAARVILLTDGLANAGVTDDAEIAAASKAFNEHGIDLSTIGVGDNFNHGLLDRLARAGRGSFHFVADRQDVDKVFVQEAQSLMGIVARNVHLTIQHGAELEVAHVYGHEPVLRGDRMELDLDNFNSGMTRVVLVRFRRARTVEAGAPVVATLAYQGADGRAHECADRAAPLRDGESDRNAIDPGVRKNFTIAVMARGLRRMAECARDRQLGEAERHLARALDYADEQYPNPHDPDLLAVRNMLLDYRKILQARIEAYRDL